MKRLLKKAVAVALVVAFGVSILFVFSASKADDTYQWNMFRHDQYHTGVSMVTSISPPLFLHFKLKLEAPTDSSPAIVGDNLFVGDKNGNFYAFSLGNSALLWKKNYSGEAIDSSPAVWNGKIYFGDHYGNFFCINVEDGKLLWKFTAGNAIISSPLVVQYKGKNLVFFGSNDRTIYCLDADSGKEIMQYTTGGEILSSPVLFKDSIIVGSFDGYLYRFDLSSGHIVWKEELQNELVGVTNKIYSSPAVDVTRNEIFVGSYNHYLYAINGDTGKVDWTVDCGTEIYSSPAIYQNTIVCGAKDKVLAIDIDSGKVLWTFGCSGNLFSSPTVENGYVFVSEKDGEFSCLNIQTGEREWNFKSDSGSKSGPVIGKDNIYFTGGNAIYAFTDQQRSANPILIVSDNKLDFGKLQKGQSSTQYVYLKNAHTDVMTGQTIGLLKGSISTNVQWISVSPANFVGNNQTVTININTNDLEEGKSYSGEIFIHTNGGDAVIKVTVTILINPNPIISVAKKSFEISLDKPDGVIKQIFYIMNSHKDPNTGKWVGLLKGTLKANADWIKIYPTSFESNKQLVNVEFDTSSFEYGHVYNGVIDVTSNGGSVSIAVSISVKEKPKKKIIITLQPDNPYMTVDGKMQEIDPGRGTKPVIIPKWGRTVVPIRAIVEALGGKIEWDGNTRKVTILFNGVKIELWIGKPQARVNGIMKWIDPNNHDVRPIIVNDRTMLPLRFVAENLGCSVNWDPKTRTITIVYQEH